MKFNLKTLTYIMQLILLVLLQNFAYTTICYKVDKNVYLNMSDAIFVVCSQTFALF